MFNRYRVIKKKKRTIILFVIILVVLSSIHQIICAQTNPNTITFDNKSGELGLVKLIGPTEHAVVVPSNQSKTVNVDAGQYYILVRYGSKSEDYKYSKGDLFNVSQTATKFSKTTITLHKVVDGNYKTNPISAKVFNAYNIKEKSVDKTNVSSVGVNKTVELIKSDKSNWLLQATQDNESLMKLIGKYIEKYYGVFPNYKFDQNDNMILTYDQSAGDSPEIRIFVESLPTWHKKDGEDFKVTERRIRLSSFINISDFIGDAAIRNKILELNNKWHNKTWVPHRIFITNNNRLAMQSSINIPGKAFPIKAELVRDLIARTLLIWDDYSTELLEIFNQPTK